MANDAGARGALQTIFALFFFALALHFPSPLPAQGIRATASGEVARAGSFALDNGARFSDLIAAAGGFTEDAWPKQAMLIRSSAREEQARQLAQAISTIREVLRGSKIPGERQERFLAFLATLKPSGRVPVRLSHPRLLKGTQADIQVMDGDHLFLPPRGGKVEVAGAVKDAGASQVPPGRGYGEYIAAAGGYADQAQRNEAYLLTGEGIVAPLDEPWIRWNAGSSRWELPAFFSRDRPRIEAGDTIVVPGQPSAPLKKADSRRLFAALRDVTRITGAYVDPP